MLLYKELDVNLQNICQLNHFVHSYSAMSQQVGKPYETLNFHGVEKDAQHNPWKYFINEYGYRGNTWSFDRESIAFFGCSITFGIGVEIDIASKFEHMSKRVCHNIGQPGASSLVILKTFVEFNNLHPVDLAVITLPQIERIYYPNYNYKRRQWEYSSLQPSFNQNLTDIHDSAYKFFTKEVSCAYLSDYIKFAQMSAKVNRTKILWYCWDPISFDIVNGLPGIENLENIDPICKLDTGRDNLHPGSKFVNAWCYDLLKKIQ